MSSDRSWMQHRFDERNNITDEYKDGVKEFIDFALKKKDTHGNIRCPCNECGNLSFHQPERVTYHLYRYGIIEVSDKTQLHTGHRLLGDEERKLAKYYVLGCHIFA
ncbi:hypothetical protein POM88_034823 [Heracleum sosnowskyi]|uniref:Transposase-associated domain-containing protein n=1 Tax=Heracleum sosnowskyi TaxID=360622 RepID=A0AAD8MCN5_9APIA|nr:hypothetical protein POM88_034823 [Heracleum sosnowskyi]